MDAQSHTYEAALQSISRYEAVNAEDSSDPMSFQPFRQPARTLSFNKNMPGPSGPLILGIIGDEFPDAKPGDVFTVVITKQASA